MSEPQCKRSKMANSLEQLKNLTVVVADTGDFEGTVYHIVTSCYVPVISDIIITQSIFYITLCSILNKNWIAEGSIADFWDR